MTISSTTDRVSFEGNGVTTSFPLPFRFFSNEDIQASLIDAITGLVTSLSLGVDYTLLGAGAPEQNGSPESAIEIVVAPATGKTLFVQRVMDIVQPTDIVNQGRFFPEVHETVFDRLTMLVQQAALGPSRTIRVPESDPIPGRLPSADARARKVFGFDGNGDPIVSSLSMSAIEQQPLLAQEAAANAVLSADEASGFADASLLSAQDSADSALLAQKWAENPEDAPVLLGKFSALHWAAKAEQSLSVLSSDLADLDSSIDFTIIYPNGGSAGSPGNVALNSRYVEVSPFPGHAVLCKAEILLGGVWGDSGLVLSGSASNGGVIANQLGDNIVVQTGQAIITGSSNVVLSPFGRTAGNVTTPTPCRVKVWKVKGAIA